MKKEAMRNKLKLFLLLVVSSVFGQQSDPLDLKLSNNFVYSADDLSLNNDFTSAEADYRKALSKLRDNETASFNLGNTYYENENFEEALYRYQEVLEHAISKEDKHKTFHNIGNILMSQKRCKEAVEAYKNGLRLNPKDDETRYNYALAKECMENQSDKNPDDEGEDEENKDQNEEKDKEEKNEDDQKKDGDDQKDKNNQESHFIFAILNTIFFINKFE